MECPKCGLLCPNAAQYCDCGFSIAGGPARPAFAPIPQGRELPPNPAALIVTGFGAILTVVSMFMDHLSSTQVSTIHSNLVIENKPVTLLCTIAAAVGAVRFASSGSKSSARNVWWAGLWFLGWTIYDGFSSQLNNVVTHEPIQTSPGAGLWALGVGCGIVFLGGLMMRYPQSGFGLVSGPSLPAGEQQAGATTKQCPRCAETIKAAAVACRFCNHQFQALTS